MTKGKKKSHVGNSHDEIRLPFSILVNWQSDLVVRISKTRLFFFLRNNILFLGTNVLATRELPIVRAHQRICGFTGIPQKSEPTFTCGLARIFPYIHRPRCSNRMFCLYHHFCAFGLFNLVVQMIYYVSFVLFLIYFSCSNYMFCLFFFFFLVVHVMSPMNESCL